LREGRQNSLNCSLLPNHVEVIILLICEFLVHFLHVLYGFWMFPISNIGILYFSGESSRFLLFIVIIVSGMCMFMCLSFLNRVCWVRGNFSGEPGPVYMPCVCLRCAECRAGTSIFGHFSGVGGGTVRIFCPLWLCSGGYSTIEMVEGLVRVFFTFFSLLSVLLAVGYLR
jgi:hypothetical protein